MEGMITFLGIVMLIFGILQIILFFKLWGMTDNVRWIKRHLGKEEDQQRAIMKAICKRDPNLEQLLFDYAYALLYRVYGAYNDLLDNNPQSEYFLNLATERFEKALRRISVAYNAAGIAVPEVFSAIKSCEDFDAYFSLPKE